MVSYKSMEESQICPKCGSKHIKIQASENNSLLSSLLGTLIGSKKASLHSLHNRKCLKCGHTWFDHARY